MTLKSTKDNLPTSAERPPLWLRFHGINIAFTLIILIPLQAEFTGIYPAFLDALWLMMWGVIAGAAHTEMRKQEIDAIIERRYYQSIKEIEDNKKAGE